MKVSEAGLVALVDMILVASEDDAVIKIEFEPKDYVAFCNSMGDPKRIESASSDYASFSRKVPSPCRYDTLCSEMLSFRGKKPLQVEKFNTAQVIYRF